MTKSAPFLMKDLLTFFQKNYPLSTVQPWDNVGILIPPPPNPTKKVLLTIDLTDKVIEECIKLNIKKIVTYHPVIFHPIKRIEEGMCRIICNGMGVLCVHTALDNRMNEELLRQVFKSEDQKEDNEEFNEKFEESITTKNTTTYISTPTHPLQKIISNLKSLLKIHTLRIAYGVKHHSTSTFKRVYCGVGSGNFPKTNETNEENQMTDNLIITGEMSHHSILNYTKYNNTVIMLEHCRSERWFLEYLKTEMEIEMDGYEFVVAGSDMSPISFV